MSFSKDDGKGNTICGGIVTALSFAPTFTASLVGGVANLARGKSFDEGFDKTSDSVDNLMDPVVKFADKHSDFVVKSVIGGAFAFLGGAATGRALNIKR